MRAFEVVANMASAVSAPISVHLDALLAFGMLSMSDATPPTRATPVDDLPVCQLPVRQVTARGVSVVMCSVMLTPAATRGITHQTRRRDAGDVDRLAKSFVPSTGPGRDRLRRLPLLNAREVRFLAWGDPHVTMSLLASVRHLGKDRGTGHGRVLDWAFRELGNVDPVRVVVDEDGRALRHLPIEWCRETDGRTGSAAVEQPYWHPARQRMAARVGTRVRLHDDVVEAIRACR
jgi:CRISPR type IV-associated protein Csf3